MQLLGGLIGLALAQDGHGLVIDGDGTDAPALGRPEPLTSPIPAALNTSVLSEPTCALYSETAQE